MFARAPVAGRVTGMYYQTNKEDVKIMKPSKDAARPSALAINPHNREASARRRVKLLAAFDSLPEDTRADLLEAVESLVGTAQTGVNLYRDDALEVIQQVYAAAGWE